MHPIPTHLPRFRQSYAEDPSRDFLPATKLAGMVYVVWFKTDLRWHDHAPLAKAAMWAELDEPDSAVLPLWVYEPAMWQQADMAAQHLGFANQCLSELSDWVQHDAQTTTRCINNPGLCRAHGDMLRVVMALLNSVGPFTLVSREETGNGWS